MYNRKSENMEKQKMTMLLRLFHTCVFFSLCHVLYGNGVSEQKPSSYKILEHESLEIVCNATEDNDIEIYWTKNETNNDFYQAGANLTFADITRFDSGNYVCHALNMSLPGNNETDNNVTVEAVNVDVLYPAEIVDFALTPDNVIENETYSIQCYFMGNPPPTWEVRNNYTKHTFGKATYLAVNVTVGPVQAQCGTQGFIECTGYNELIHDNVTRGENLTVFCAPRPIPDISNTTLSIVGGQAWLIMNVIGYPYPSYTWSRADDKPMPAHYNQLDYPSFAVLNITNIAVEDFGIYILTMNNSYGTDQTSLELRAYGRPESPYNLTYTNVTYNSVTLSWVSGFDMGSKQHFMVFRRFGTDYIQTSNNITGSYDNGGVGHHWMYTKNNLDADTEYTLSVVAMNDLGYISKLATPPVSFKTKVDPNAPEGNSSETAIIAGSVAGGVVFVACLAFIVYMVIRRKRRASYESMKGSANIH